MGRSFQLKKFEDKQRISAYKAALLAIIMQASRTLCL
jgi:hypothetical protein